MTLEDIKPGKRARVTHCLGDGPIFQRLCEMGVVEGAELRVVRFAPFGDPMHVALRDFHLSLRRSEARMIHVEHLAS